MIFAFGIMGILNYEINLLTALVPPVIIVIGIPNCIFLINKYHTEFKKNKNKDKSLHLVKTPATLQKVFRYGRSCRMVRLWK